MDRDGGGDWFPRSNCPRWDGSYSGRSAANIPRLRSKPTMEEQADEASFQSGTESNDVAWAESQHKSDISKEITYLP